MILFGGCSRNDIKISGRFVGYDDKPVYLQAVLPGGTELADSVSTDNKGYFRFDIRLKYGQPTFYNIICDGETVPLLLEPGDRINIYAIGSIPDYTVEGSPGSARMRELKRLLSQGAFNLDSILTLYGNSDGDLRSRLSADYTREYYRTKREHIAFIVSDPGSLSSLYALYQRLPGDLNLFSGENDILYYRLVADSASVRYPDSPYVTALRKEIDAAESEYEMHKLIEQKLLYGERASFPDIIMADMYGNERKLSELTGKVVLLDFWSALSPQSRLLNAELKDLYSVYADDGFQVYQVNIDTDRAVWVNAVINQRLPWINVSDLKGISGTAPMTYNVGQVPANFLIDSEGNITDRNIYGPELSRKVARLLELRSKNN